MNKLKQFWQAFFQEKNKPQKPIRLFAIPPQWCITTKEINDSIEEQFPPYHHCSHLNTPLTESDKFILNHPIL